MGTTTADVRELSGLPDNYTPEDGAVWFSPFRAYHVEDGPDDFLVSSEILKVRLVDGVAAVDLPETPVDNLMKVQLRGVRGYGAPWYVQIPAGDCNLFELTHIDPDTMDPDVEPDAAWLALLNARVPATGTTGYVLTKGAGANNVWTPGGGGGGGAVDSVNGDSGPDVLLNQDDIPDGTTAKQYTATEKTKLSGIATGATSNQSDATTNAAIAAKKTDSMATNRLLGRGTASTGAIEEITLGTNLSLTGTTLNASGGGGVVSTASTATLTVASDDYDAAEVTAQAAGLTIAAPTGTPTEQQSLIIRIKDNGTARALTWNAAFRAIGVTLPTTTVISKTVVVGCMWNTTASKWDVVAVAQEA